MPTNQSQYEEMCEVYERYNKGCLVPVVRCKDCKFWHIEGQYCDRFGVMWEEFYTSPNDYCSNGERREDETVHG